MVADALLVVHDSLYEPVSRFANKLRLSYSDIVRYSDLRFERVRAYIVGADRRKMRRASLALESYYKPAEFHADEIQFGARESYYERNPYVCAYVPKSKLGYPLQRLRTYKNPRFVIWPIHSRLRVNANAVAYCRPNKWTDVRGAVLTSIRWVRGKYAVYFMNSGDGGDFYDESSGIGDRASTTTTTTDEKSFDVRTATHTPIPKIGLTRDVTCCVFDLDDTLICSRNSDRLLDGALRMLRRARDSFTYLVLYSHGDQNHVFGNICVKSFVFDFIICHDDRVQPRGIKNLLRLYDYLPATDRIVYALLVDDSVYNWAHEYDDLIVPSRENRDVDCLLLALDRVVTRRRIFPNIRSSVATATR